MKKLLAFCLMLSFSVVPAWTETTGRVVLEEGQDVDQQKPDKGAKREADIRAKVRDMELGQKVKVKLVSDQEIKGEIQSVESDRFIIANSKTGLIKTVAFSEVAEIRKDKMPAWKKAAIIGGVVAGILAVLAYAGLKNEGKI